MADLNDQVMDAATNVMEQAGMAVERMDIPAKVEKSTKKILKTIGTFAAGTAVGYGAKCAVEGVKSKMAENEMDKLLKQRQEIDDKIAKLEQKQAASDIEFEIVDDSEE